MTKAQEQAHKLMKTIKHDSRNKISEEFLYNAICYFEIEPEDVITLLSEMSKESCEKIATLFTNTRVQVKKILEKNLSEVDISDALVCGNKASTVFFHDKDFFMRAFSYYMRILDMHAA